MADHAENEIRRRLLERISSLSAPYAPEWRFNREQPDLGSAGGQVTFGYRTIPAAFAIPVL